MQLKKNSSIKSALSLATCSLLSTSISAEPSFKLIEEALTGTELKASNMFYAEDERVRVNETLVSLKKDLEDEEYFKLTLIADVMSGASPNGLPPINKPQESDTYTSPSGSTIQPVAGKEQTFHFRDTRNAINLEWQKPLSRLLKTATGLSFSSEYDYTSAGASSSWYKDTPDRLTTFSTGLAFNYDIIKPVGGAHIELEPISNEAASKFKYKSEYDFLFGVTQVVTRSTLIQTNYVANVKSGYLADPYKLVIFLDNDDLAPVNLNPYYYEKRPDSRLSHIAYLNLIQNIYDDVLRLSYRYFNDDWGISSHTTEARYLFNLNQDSAIQFKYRFYTQNAAYFYHYYLVDGSHPNVESRDVVNLPSDLKYVSADYRLGNLRSHSFGVKLSKYFMQREARVDLRVDRIVSSDRKNRFATVRAWVLQIAGKILF